MERRNYTLVDWQPVLISTSVNRTFECNTLIFKNQGTQNVTIDGQCILTPGESITFEQYPGEMLIRAYDIVFTNDLQAGASLLAYCKVYLHHRTNDK